MPAVAGLLHARAAACRMTTLIHWGKGPEKANPEVGGGREREEREEEGGEEGREGEREQIWRNLWGQE